MNFRVLFGTFCLCGRFDWNKSTRPPTRKGAKTDAKFDMKNSNLMAFSASAFIFNTTRPPCLRASVVNLFS